MRYLKPVYLFVVLIMVSCVPEPLDIDLPQAETKLVISSQVIPNSIMIVAVSKSFGALDYSEDYDTTSLSSIENIFVKNAEVTISYNGITDKLFPVSDAAGIYFSLTTPQYLNTEYTLKVYDPETGLSVSSKVKMLKQIMFDKVEAIKDYNGDSNDINVHFEFNDPSDEKNWYMINFYNPNIDTLNNGGSNLFQKKTNQYHTVLLSDAVFDDSGIKADITLYQWDTDSIAVSLSNISEGYYNYLSARKRGGTLMASLMREPINYPTNIEGGYGFFTTHFPDIWIVNVK